MRQSFVCNIANSATKILIICRIAKINHKITHILQRFISEYVKISSKQAIIIPLPAESDRGKKYNPVLSQLEALTNEMTAIGQKYGASCSQIGIAWAIAKGTLPIIGATKERHVIEAAEAAKIQLTAEEIAKLEALADATGIDTRGGWEHSME